MSLIAFECIMDGHEVRNSVLGKGRSYVDEIEGCELSLEAQPDLLHLKLERLSRWCGFDGAHGWLGLMF